MIPAHAGNEASRAGVFSVEGNVVLTCSLELKESLPVDNYRCTETEKIAYTGLYLASGRNGKMYLAARKKSLSGWSWALPKGAIVYVHHGTGSRKHTYHRYIQYFIVAEGKFEGVLEDEKGEDSYGKINIKFTTVNLKPIQYLDEKVLAEVEAEIMNHGWLPSFYDPVRILYYYWMRWTLATKASGDLDKQIEELKRLVEEKEKELAELKAKLEDLIKQKSISGRVVSMVR
jgi:hypothetical protein